MIWTRKTSNRKTIEFIGIFNPNVLFMIITVSHGHRMSSFFVVPVGTLLDVVSSGIERNLNSPKIHDMRIGFHGTIVTFLVLSISNLNKYGMSHSTANAPNKIIVTFLFSTCMPIFLFPESKRKVICENSKTTLSCPSNQVINIKEATYGRSNKRTCKHPNMKTTRCSTNKPLGISRKNCNGRKSCTVSANNGLYGDPCPGTYKYVTVSYSCKGMFVIIYLCHDYVLKLKSQCKSLMNSEIATVSLESGTIISVILFRICNYVKTFKV